MMPKSRSRKRPPVGRTLRVFCEGEKTEPYYIEDYIRHFKDDRKTSIKVEKCDKNTPVQLVEAAIKSKESDKSVEGDEFWVVYDRESVAKYTRTLHLKAWNNARANGVNIALSNVCFEYWILLHFVSSSAAYGSFDDLKEKSVLFDEVQKFCGKKYDKASAVLFEVIKGEIETARNRASTINAQGLQSAGAQCKPFDINPYTDMPKLLKAIDKF